MQDPSKFAVAAAPVAAAASGGAPAAAAAKEEEKKEEPAEESDDDMGLFYLTKTCVRGLFLDGFTLEMFCFLENFEV